MRERQVLEHFQGQRQESVGTFQEQLPNNDELLQMELDTDDTDEESYVEAQSVATATSEITRQIREDLNIDLKNMKNDIKDGIKDDMKEWQDQLMNEVKKMLRPLLLQAAPLHSIHTDTTSDTPTTMTHSQGRNDGNTAEPDENPTDGGAIGTGT